MTARWDSVLVVVRLALIATVVAGRVRPLTVTTLFSVTPPVGTRTSATTTGVAVRFTTLDRWAVCTARGVDVAVIRALVDMNVAAVVTVARGPTRAVTVEVVNAVGMDNGVAVLVFVGAGAGVFVGAGVAVSIGVAVLVGLGVAVLVFVDTGGSVAVSGGTGVAVAGLTMTMGAVVRVLVGLGALVAVFVAVGTAIVALGGTVAVAVEVGAPPAPVQSVARLARLGEPHPVASSHPVPAG
jgi:hypothetical protein